MKFTEFLDGYYDVECQLQEYLKREAFSHFEKLDKTRDEILCREDFEAVRASFKENFFNAIGGMDFKKTPLNTVCTGIIEREEYIVKKVIFQSLPGIYVTSNLYLPKVIDGRLPAVLFACGHDETAKASPLYQKVCMDLVRNGFIVLSMDPISQGERMQYYDKGAGRNLVRWHAEHTYVNLQCDLTGSSIIRYFLWDLIRAVDYLCSIPEVDESRIGMTGNSGGAMQTTFMMMGDERISAAAPCTYITTREELIKCGLFYEGEMISRGAFTKGPGFDDFITCLAPKPVMIGACESDYFGLDGVMQTFRRAQQIYRLYGCEENVCVGLARGTHEYNDELRQKVVNWFIEKLKGEKGNFTTQPDMRVEDVKTLQCTVSGQVLEDFEDAGTVYDLNIEYLNEHKYVKTSSREEIGGRLEKLLNMPVGRSRILPRVISVDIIDNRDNIMDNLRQSNIFFYSEKDIIVAGTYIEVSERKSSRCTILVTDEGVNNINMETDLINKLLQQGDVFAFDPRGTGVVRNRTANDRPFYEMFGTEYKLSYEAMMMDRSMTGFRVYDILRACDYIRQTNPDMKIGLAGKGISAVYTLFAAVLRDEADYVYLENMIPSFENIVCTRFYRYDVRYSLYGVLKDLDIPMILEAFKDKNITCFTQPDIGNTIKRK